MPPASDSPRATTATTPPTPPTGYRESALVVFALLLAFRIVNALTLRTFFQPDEYFQSLEPAWQLAFGEAGDAWITWVMFPLTLSTAVYLMARAGVENAVAVVPASRAIFCSLSTRGKSCRPRWLDAASKSRAAHGNPEGYTSHLRSVA
jgi:hypothetical protein